MQDKMRKRYFTKNYVRSVAIQKQKLYVDLLTFENRPFKGVSSIITNGIVSLKEKGDELMLSFDHKTSTQGVNLNAFIATYLQLYYVDHKNDVAGSYFSAHVPVLNGYKFTGTFTTSLFIFLKILPKKIIFKSSMVTSNL
jgi:hypothetical protein